MGKRLRDHSLDTLLDLDGQIFVVDPEGKHWVKFSVQRVDPTPERPHGLSYSLTLHDEGGERVVGFDNAHPVQPTKGPAASRGGGRIIDIGCERSGHATTRTPRHC